MTASVGVWAMAAVIGLCTCRRQNVATDAQPPSDQHGAAAFACWNPLTAGESLPASGAGTILWRTPVDSTGILGAVAQLGKHLGVTAGNNLYIFDDAGTRVATWRSSRGIQPSAPAADTRNGRFVVAADALYALTPAATVGFSAPLPGASESMVAVAPLIGPDSTIYSLTRTYLTAHRAESGAVVWQTAIQEPQESGRPLVGGDAGGIVVNMKRQMGFSIFSASDGKLRRSVDGGSNAAVAVWNLVGDSRYFGVRYGASLRKELVDDRGQTLWSLPDEPDSGPRYLLLEGTLAGELLVGEAKSGTAGAGAVIHRTGCNGERGSSVNVTLPVHQEMGISAVTGADGWVYMLSEPQPGYTGISLLALDPSLAMKWQVSLPGTIGASTGFRFAPVLRDDGVLIFAVQKASDTSGEVIAVQTGSPGLAATPLATPRGNNAGTGWQP